MPRDPLSLRTPPSHAGGCAAAIGRRRLIAAAAAVGAVPHLATAAQRRVLTVAAFPLVDEIVRGVLPAWKERHPGVEVQVVSRQYIDHHTAMTTALSTSVLLPDVMALEASFLGRFFHGFGLDNLSAPPYHLERERERFVRFAYDQAINRRGETVAVPTDIGPGTLLYREDIMRRAGIAEADLTHSWESYVEAGRRIRAATGAYLLANAQLLKDIVIRSGLRPGEGLFYDRDSNVLVNSPRFVRAFELARRVRREKLDARVRDWTNDWAEGFKRGTIATDLTGAWMVGQMASAVAPDTRGLWRAAALPEQTAVGFGGTYYAIPRRSDPANKLLAWSLIRWLTMRRETQFAAFKSQDAFPALVETYDDPFFDEPLPFLGGQRARQLWRDVARRIQPEEIHRQNNFASEVVATELDNVMDRGKDIARALADAGRLLRQRANR
jgi:multiple sugar transport system substrate-binding protein